MEPAAQCDRCLACPICDAELRREDGILDCENGHHFDLAKEGYVNFFAATGRASKITGDTRAMLQARRAFLEKGHYQSLSDAINRIVLAKMRSRVGQDPSNGTTCILDAGCGEGYYLGRLRAFLTEQIPDQPGCYFGSDVSRDAARLTAKRYPGVLAVVANTNQKLPFSSIDVLLNVFAPRNPAEFHRVMTSGGLLVVAIPAPRHLEEARQVLGLLTIQEEKHQQVVERLSPDFQLVGETPVEDALPLNGVDVRDLVQMGPSSFHLTESTRARLDTAKAMTVTASFQVLEFQRGK